MAQGPDDQDEVELLRRQLSEQDATIVSLLAEVDSLAEQLEQEQEVSARLRREAVEMAAALEKSAAALEKSVAASAEQQRAAKQLMAEAERMRDSHAALLEEVIRLRAERN